MKNKAAKSGFTMIEILTVIAVITILGGMMFPILNRARESAENAAAKDLCAQVAAAWNTLLIENRRYPSEDLVKACVDSKQNHGVVKEVDGDLVFYMSPGVSSLLNWWRREAAIPAADKKKFNPVYADGSKKGQSIDLKPGDDGKNVEFWPPDTRLERDVGQKRVGVYAPWVPRKLARQGIDYSPKDALTMENLMGQVDIGDIVIVALDMDGDGRVPVGISLSNDKSESYSGDAETIPASSAAWIWRHDKGRTKLVKSW